MSPAQPAGGKRLRRISIAEPPLVARPPAFVVEAGRSIHVLAMDPGNRHAVHAALDHDGTATSPVSTLPIALASAGPCGDEVIATGVRGASGVRWALGLDPAGTIRWETALPISTTGLVRVMPICIAGDSAIVWEVEKNGRGESGIVMLGGGGLERAAVSSQSDIAFGLSVAAIGSSVFVLRARGSETPAELIRIDGSAITARAPTVRNAQAIAAIGQRLVVLSWTTDALHLQWVDMSLAPLGLQETVATAGPSSWIRFATLYAVDEQRIAVSYLIGGGAGDLIPMPGGRSEPGEHAQHFVGRYNAASHALADIMEVTPAGTAWSAGAWLGNRLLLLHGATGAVLSIFELAS